MPRQSGRGRRPPPLCWQAAGARKAPGKTVHGQKKKKKERQSTWEVYVYGGSAGQALLYTQGLIHTVVGSASSTVKFYVIDVDVARVAKQHRRNIAKADNQKNTMAASPFVEKRYVNTNRIKPTLCPGTKMNYIPGGGAAACGGSSRFRVLGDFPHITGRGVM